MIEKHHSDGNRYKTPAKRRAEPERMVRYTADNPCYEYRRDAVQALLPKDVPSPVLDGLTDEVAGEVTAQGGAEASVGVVVGAPPHQLQSAVAAN